MAGKKGQAPRVEFAQSVFDEICKRIAGGYGVSEVCRGRGMPDRTTFNNWRKRSDALQAQYDRACRDREDVIFDQILVIADGDEDPQKTRVQIDARKWVLARMNAKKYGDKMDIDAKVDAKLEVVTRRIVDPSGNDE